MPFLRVMSRKKAEKKPLIPRKNLLEIVQFRGKGDRGGRGTLFLEFGEGCVTGGPQGKGVWG
jgi:hypothetical protein